KLAGSHRVAILWKIPSVNGGWLQGILNLVGVGHGSVPQRQIERVRRTPGGGKGIKSDLTVLETQLDPFSGEDHRSLSNPTSEDSFRATWIDGSGTNGPLLSQNETCPMTMPG